MSIVDSRNKKFFIKEESPLTAFKKHHCVYLFLRGMWLLFTVTILLAREVVGNLTTDEHDEEKKLANKNDLHNFSQLQTADLKIPTQKLRETAKTNEKEDAEKRRKRSIEEIVSDQKTFTTDFQKRKSPLSSWFYWADKDVIPIKERSKESSQEKKTPRFSPWGGKRSETYLPVPEIRQNTHVFNSWGGKRVNEFSKLAMPERSGKLYAWNSVDSNENQELKRVSKSNTEGKVPFNSWGGKRALNTVDYTSPILQDLHQLEGEIAYRKRKEQLGKYQEKMMRKIDERRAQKFGSWGGKRFANRPNGENLHLSGEDFFESLKSRLPKKRSMRALRKREFQPWGGKRSPETIPDNPNETERRPQASFFVRKVFFPWGG